MKLFGKREKTNTAGLLKAFGGSSALSVKILAALAFLVTLALLITDNYAWYSDNSKTNQLDISITSDATDLTLDGYSFYYGAVIRDEEGNVTEVVGTRSTPGDPQIMNSYDAIIGRNDYTPVYYKISLAGSRIESGEDIILNITRTNVAIELEDGTILSTDEEGHYYTGAAVTT